MLDLESKLQSKIMKHALQLGVISFKLESRSENGFPDVGFYYDGRHMLMEIKNGKRGVLSPSQKRVIKKLKAQNIDVHVCDNFEDAKRILECFANQI